MGRLIVIGGILLLVVGGVALAWEIADWPPPRLLLKYGFPPAGGPTGRTCTLEGVEFVELSPGCFRMGSHARCETGDLLGRICAMAGLPWGRRPRHSGVECPPRWVEFREGFWIARTEVTHEQYGRFDPGHRDLHRKTDEYWGAKGPVIRVSWLDARKYCAWLAERSGRPVRLPSEAEWEHACRAGSRSEYCFGDDPAELPEHAWVLANSGETAHAVATRPPNAWGLHDLHGNVWEWCEDTRFERAEGAPRDGSARVEEGGLQRVVRGGGWAYGPLDARSARRNWMYARFGNGNVGFRPVFTLPE
jgi:formylglycine-generating enzyme required for sulfatase activity